MSATVQRVSCDFVGAVLAMVLRLLLRGETIGIPGSRKGQQARERKHSVAHALVVDLSPGMGGLAGHGITMFQSRTGA